MSDEIHEFDTIVIGASLSGSISACLLGRSQAQRVALIDSQLFPRQKACGEGVSAIGKQHFEALGLWSQELERACYPFRGYSMEFSDGSFVRLASNTQAEGFGISRIRLDSFMYECAAKEPSVMTFNSRVVERHRLGDGWLVVTDSGEFIKAKNIVFAVGGEQGRKLLPEFSGVESEKGRYGIAFWADGYWSQQAPDTVKIFNTAEGQYVLTPLSTTRMNVSMLLNVEGAQKSKAALVEKAKGLLTNEGFIIVSTTDTKGAAAIHSYRLNTVGADFFVVGDAIERFDPVGGMGMTHAVFSAECAARAILENSDSPREACQKYYKEHRKGARLLRLLTKMSLDLNVNENVILRSLVKHLPHVSFQILGLVKSMFPKINYSAVQSPQPIRTCKEKHIGDYVAYMEDEIRV